MQRAVHGVVIQIEARDARASQVKLDSEQLERLLFQLFERKVGKKQDMTSQALMQPLLLPPDPHVVPAKRNVGLQPSWKMNELRAETRQSVESIKKILENIAVQSTRGPSRGEFELRSEYKSAGPAPTS